MAQPMPGPGSELGQALDVYWRAALQMWLLPLNVFRAVRGSTTLQSTVFSVEQPPADGTRHQLRLCAPLEPVLPYVQRQESIPTSAIRVEPAVLNPGESDFHLLIEGQSVHLLPGATYWGQVAAHDEVRGHEVGRVDVWMVVS
jgi:hypothetical protein